MSKGCGCQSGIFKHIKPPYAGLFHLPCCIHDDEYDIGGDRAARLKADRNLFRRCITIVSRADYSPWKMMWLSHIAMLYYLCVRIFGRFYFSYTKK